MWSRGIFLSLCSLLVAAGADERDGTRLAFRAKLANFYEFPHQISLQVYNGQHICGGALISPTHVLTAAHCINNTILDLNEALQMTVEIGTTTIGQGQTCVIRRLSHHYGYDPNGKHHQFLPNDIAVITLQEPVKQSGKVRIISLPSPGFEVQDGQSLTISGWGSATEKGNTSSVLKKSLMNVLPAGECSEYFRTLYDINSAQICAQFGKEEGHGTCHGDSGGPLIMKLNNYQSMVVGVASGGVCGAAAPDIYTKVSSYIEYIQHEMEYDFQPGSYVGDAKALNLDAYRMRPNFNFGQQNYYYSQK